MPRVRNLLIKNKRRGPIEATNKFHIEEQGIIGNKQCLPLRQILILPYETLLNFDIAPGDLRENVIIDGIGSEDMISGKLLRLGDIEIRLTFPCETCSVIKDVVDLKAIRFKRGFFGQFLNTGVINMDDEVTLKRKEFDHIPFKIADRIKWYLGKIDSPVMVSKLVYEIGLPNAYCRAIPNIVRNRADIDKKKIMTLKGPL